MAVKWPLFTGAALLAGVFLLSYGAPLGPYLAGTGLAAVWNWRQLR